ncbi:hypothetical protein HZA55_07600 [Candidatus Poribacteria bacterium]|nr:hypothetical protein [Candidatus Poribacteria bacterium]
MFLRPTLKYVYSFAAILYLSITVITYAEIVTYDPKILEMPRSGWIKPLELYSRGTVKSISEIGIEIDIGKLHGVHTGFIYDIYTNDKKIGQLCITSVTGEYSLGYMYKKEGDVNNKSIAIFTNKIDDAENMSYRNRWSPKLYGTITFISENYCFINLNATDGVSVGMKFNVYDNVFTVIETIEIVEISLQDPSIAKIVNPKKKLKIGQKVQNIERDKAGWASHGDKLASNKDYLEDAIYAYEKILEQDNDDSFTKRRIVELSKSVARQYENDGYYDYAILYLKKALSSDMKYEKEYLNLRERTISLADKALAEKKYLLPIKYLECLDRTAEIEDAIAQAYYLYILKLEKEGNFDLSHEYQESIFRISNRNYFIGEKLIKYYLSKNDYNKVEELINSVIKIAGDKASRNYLQEVSDFVVFKRDRIFPGNMAMKNMNGETITLDSFSEPLILLYIWKSSSFDNSMGLSFLEKMAENYKDKSLRIIAINIDMFPLSIGKEEEKNKENIKKFLNQFKKISFDVVFLRSRVNQFIELANTPIVIILTKNKSILYLKDTKFDNEEIYKVIRKFFNET